jgi:hypothetical protein
MMLRNRFGRLALVGAALLLAGPSSAQTKCRGYITSVWFGEVCSWGCGDKQECNCTVGACADGTVVVL